jgi:hypothetical protein
MEPSSTAPSELAQLLELVATALLPETHPLVLRHLPTVELARLACVHKAFHVAWRSLQGQHDGERYSPPTDTFLESLTSRRRLERAAAFGDVAVIRSMVAAGVDEHGSPLLEARGYDFVTLLGVRRQVDEALWHAAARGHLQAVELLLGYGADVHARHEWATRAASHNGHTDVVQLLLQHGANRYAAWP